MIKIYSTRFTELTEQLAKVAGTKNEVLGSRYVEKSELVDAELFLNWRVKATNLISKACGENSIHLNTFNTLEKDMRHGGDGSLHYFKKISAVFMAAKEDFEGGYLNTVRNLIHAEVFDSELEQATELLNSGYIMAAAVVAGTVLETTLRSLCDDKNIPSNTTANKMNEDLTKAGVHNMLVQKQLTALLAVRNSAAHGKVDDFDKGGVQNMIAEIRRYVAEVLG